MLRRAMVTATLFLLPACGGGETGGPATTIPEGRCEKDADCKADERCAQVAMICEVPPYCGACVPQSP